MTAPLRGDAKKAKASTKSTTSAGEMSLFARPDDS